MSCHVRPPSSERQVPWWFCWYSTVPAPSAGSVPAWGAAISTWCTQRPTCPSDAAAGWSCPSPAAGSARSLRRSHVPPPSTVVNTPAAEMPTHMRSGSAGSGTIVCSVSPAAPGPQSVADGWSVRPLTCENVRPSSSLSSRVAGLVPAWTRPLAHASDHTCANESPKGAGSPVQPILAANSGSSAAQSSICPVVSFVSSQVRPPSAERHTPAPVQSLPPPAHIVPVTGSATTWLMVQPSQNGPRTVHPVRSCAPSRMNAPFVVPTSRWSPSCVMPLPSFSHSERRGG